MLKAAKTYDWMTATADSRTNKRIWEIIKIGNKVFPIEGPVFPKRVSNRWPAIIFAANRMAKVPGRITFLTVSINTIKGVNPIGVPAGTKWANMCLVWFSQPKIINEAHKGKARDKVIAICLVLVKI